MASGHAGLDTMVLWAVLAGVTGGLSAALFREANDGLKWLFTHHKGDIVTIAESVSPDMRLLVPTLGGFLAGLVLWLGGRLLKGLQAQEYLEVIRLGNGVISIKPTLTRLLSSLISISSGSSIGREGGMVQLSTLLASTIGRLFNFSQPRLRLLVACGGAAGMASAYNAPLAGALFIAEIVLQSLTIEALGPLIVSAVTATLVIRQWTGGKPIFELPEFTTRIPDNVGFILGLGIVAGLLAPVFLYLLEVSRRFFSWLRLPAMLSLALGGFIVGALSLYLPEVWGNGYAAIQVLLNDSPVPGFVLSLLVFKVLATTAAVGTGTIGGVFTPSLLTGACTGWLFAHGLNLAFPEAGLDTVTFTALGMGSFLSATTLAPLMAIVMIFEMTLDANLLFPLIVASLSARYLAAAIRPVSVYARSLGDAKTALPCLMHVADLQGTPGAVIRAGETADRVSELFCLTTTQQVWVVDDEGHFSGVISLQAMKGFLGDSTLKDLCAASVFMDDDLPVVTPDTALTVALSALINRNADCLPVVDASGKLVGEISKNDILLVLS